MSIIKEILDVATDAAALAAKTGAIKRALRAELKLNAKCLSDIKEKADIDDERRKEIINMLDVNELSAAVRYEIPYFAISRKKVSTELATDLKMKRLDGANIEELIESLYLMICYLKKDHNNKRIHLNLRLNNVYKYNLALIDLLR